MSCAQGVFRFVEENNGMTKGCYYLFELEHEAACSPSSTLNTGSILLIVYVSFLLIYTQQQKYPAHCVCILLAHLHSTTEVSCSLYTAMCILLAHLHLKLEALCSLHMIPKFLIAHLHSTMEAPCVCVSYLFIYIECRTYFAYCVCILLAHLYSTLKAIMDA